jgi:hypothetical protein
MIWKLIPGFPRYEVSSCGQVRSLRYKGTRVIRAVTPIVGMDGYRKISIYNRSGQRKTKRIARLILGSFLGPCPKGMQAAHLNGVRTDDRLENLVWATSKTNHAQMREHGTSGIGERNPKAKLSEEDVRNIRASYASGSMDGVQLASHYGVRHPTIYAIIHRLRWSHVP